MSYLYFSCSEQKAGRIVEFFQASGRKLESAGVANGLAIILLADPTDHDLELTSRLISQKQLNSAALVESKLSSDRLFIAAEWWHRLVCEKSERILATIVRLTPLLHQAGEHQSLGLAIFEVRDVPSDDDDDDDFINLARISEELVLSNPEKYYERFARAEVGGANALFAAGQEAARMRRLPLGTILVGPPEALGFEVDQNPDSVIGWSQKKVISVSAFGFSLSRTNDALSEWTDITQVSFQKCIGAEQTANWEAEGIAFGLAIVLRGIKDPPVVIPVGSVYQQSQMGSKIQNLAVARSGTYPVGAGATVPLVLPAWCINRTYSPPHSQMTPTPLMVRHASGSQQNIWDRIDRGYESAR